MRLGSKATRVRRSRQPSILSGTRLLESGNAWLRPSLEGEGRDTAAIRWNLSVGSDI
jgi:hypothetical protein